MDQPRFLAAVPALPVSDERRAVAFLSEVLGMTELQHEAAASASSAATGADPAVGAGRQRARRPSVIWQVPILPDRVSAIATPLYQAQLAGRRGPPNASLADQPWVPGSSPSWSRITT